MVAKFPQASPTGQEQTGERPAVVVGVPDFIEQPRFPGLILVPFTSKIQHYTNRSRVLYPLYLAGTGGLTKDSIALLDQVRFLDASRLTGYLGHLTDTEYEPVKAGLHKMFGCS